MRGGDFIFDSVQLMCYNCLRLNFRCGGSYIDSPDQIEKKKRTINPKNTDDKCSQYTATIALNYEEIKWNLERVSTVKPCINITGKKYICQKQMIGKCLRKIAKNCS